MMMLVSLTYLIVQWKYAYDNLTCKASSFNLNWKNLQNMLVNLILKF
jgi:uncharacterized membrane protein